MSATLAGQPSAALSLFPRMGTGAALPRSMTFQAAAPVRHRAAAGKLQVRIAIAARTLAATLGNYAVTALATALIARLWAIAPAQASMASMLIALAIFPVIALASFAIKSAWRVWTWLFAAGAVLGGGLWLSLAAGTPL